MAAVGCTGRSSQTAPYCTKRCKPTTSEAFMGPIRGPGRPTQPLSGSPQNKTQQTNGNPDTKPAWENNPQARVSCAKPHPHAGMVCCPVRVSGACGQGGVWRWSKRQGGATPVPITSPANNNGFARSKRLLLPNIFTFSGAGA